MKNDKKGEISLLGRVFLLVRNLFEKFIEMRLPQKFIAHQKGIAGYEDENSPKEAKISFILNFSKTISFTLLCIILVVALLLSGSIFSFNNVYYMLKDISYISSFSETRPSSLSYSRPFTNQDFAVFKGGLSVAGDGEIKFFTSTGRATLTEGSEFSNPKICSSDSTVLIYDQGRRTFKIYNSFVCIYSETLEYPISSAYMAPDGSFCIVTKSESYGSVVRIYDKKQRLESEFSRNDYITTVSMSSDGDTIAVASLDAANGQSITTLTILERGKKKARSSVEILDFLPFNVTFTANDRIALIGTDSARVYNLNANLMSEQNYPGKLVNISVNDGGFALLFNGNASGADHMLSVYGANGSHVSTHNIDGSVKDIAINGNFVYLLKDGEVIRIDSLFGTSLYKKVADSSAELLVISSSDLLVCTDSTAYFLSFN